MRRLDATLTSQMLLLFKMNDCLRHVDRALGAPLNTLVITAEQCAKAVWVDRVAASTGFRATFRAWCDYTNVWLRLKFVRLTAWYHNGAFVQNLYGR